MSNFNPLYADELSQMLLAPPAFYPTPQRKMGDILPSPPLGQLTPEEQYAIEDATRRQNLGEPPALLARPVGMPPPPEMTEEELASAYGTNLQDQYQDGPYAQQSSSLMPQSPGAEMLIAAEALREAGKMDEMARAAELQLQNALTGQQKFLSSQIKTPEQVAAEEKEYLDSVKRFDEDRQIIMDKLNNLKPQKDSIGMRLGKALAVGLGAFGSSLTGTPNYALQIIQSGAETAARELASDRENTYKLLGLNREQRERLDATFSSRQQLQNALKSQIIGLNVQKAQAAAQAAQSPSEKAKYQFMAAQLMQEVNKIDKDFAIKLAQALESKEKETRGKGIAPKSTSEIDDETFRSLTGKQQDDIIRSEKALSDFNSTYSDMFKLISSYSNLTDFDKKASIERFKRDLGLLIKEAEGLGVPNANDAVFMDLQKDPIGIFTSGRGLSELKTLVYQTMRKAKNTFNTYGIPLKNVYDLRIEQLGRDIGVRE